MTRVEYLENCSIFSALQLKLHTPVSKLREAMWFHILTRIPLYAPLAADSDQEAKSENSRNEVRKRNSRWNILLLLTASFASGTLGFVFARFSDGPSMVHSPSGPQCVLIPRFRDKVAWA
ncbi:hypothetical protein NHQ30_008238 [Ciborinia camelliae]|nr:hypothetical protein NHQ30_008238 [Ciborinia camelliae]